MPLDGSYEGIGAYVDASGDYLTIITPMAGSPAETAGLKSGDEITAIDGNNMTGIDPNIVLQSVLGPAGSSVFLTIHSPYPDSTLDVTIKRAKIVVPQTKQNAGRQNGYIPCHLCDPYRRLKKASQNNAQNPRG